MVQPVVEIVYFPLIHVVYHDLAVMTNPSTRMLIMTRAALCRPTHMNSPLVLAGGVAGSTIPDAKIFGWNSHYRLSSYKGYPNVWRGKPQGFAALGSSGRNRSSVTYTHRAYFRVTEPWQTELGLRMDKHCSCVWRVNHNLQSSLP